MLRSRILRPLILRPLISRPGLALYNSFHSSVYLPNRAVHNFEVYDPMQGAQPKPRPPKGQRPVTVEFELPDVEKERKSVRRSFIVFCILMGVSVFGIVKYEEANSPVVSSTLYTLRRSPKGHDVFGDNIQFASLLPWISGSLSAGRGVVDFEYSVRGDKGSGRVHFCSVRDPYLNKYVVQDWSIVGPNGESVPLMDEDFHPFVPGANQEATRVRS